MKLSGSLLLAVLLCAASSVRAGDLSVQVREGLVRQGPSFLTPVVESLPYGARVAEKETRGRWVRVGTRSGKTGWMHDSALAEGRVALQAGEGDARTSVGGREVILAAKGFSKEVENSYRAGRGGEGYAVVDAMEARKVRAAEAIQFLREGGLNSPGEGEK